MAKSHDVKKNVKKEPAKTAKEKKAEKRDKKITQKEINEKIPTYVGDFFCQNFVKKLQ